MLAEYGPLDQVLLSRVSPIQQTKHLVEGATQTSKSKQLFASLIDLGKEPKMDFRGILSLLFLTVLVIHMCTVQSHCTNGMCEKMSFSLATDTPRKNFALVGNVLETFSFIWDWRECFKRCLQNCQCLSFNFNEVNTTENCELNDANTKVEPEALREKEEVTYYELVRSYFGNKVRKWLYIQSF